MTPQTHKKITKYINIFLFAFWGAIILWFICQRVEFLKNLFNTIGITPFDIVDWIYNYSFILIVIGTGIILLISSHKLNWKKKTVEPIVEELLPNCIYEINRGIDGATIGNYALFGPSTSIIGTDHLKGKIDGIDLEYAEMVISREIDNGDDTSNKLLFNGSIFIITQKNNIEYEVSLKGKKHKFDKGHLFSLRNEIKTESESFNSKFTIKADDEIDSFKLLTPKMMEKLEIISDKQDGEFSCAFVKNKIVLLLGKTDIFEYDTKASKEQIKEGILKDIRELLSLYEILEDKANTKSNERRA